MYKYVRSRKEHAAAEADHIGEPQPGKHGDEERQRQKPGDAQAGMHEQVATDGDRVGNGGKIRQRLNGGGKRGIPLHDAGCQTGCGEKEEHSPHGQQAHHRELGGIGRTTAFAADPEDRVKSD